MDREAVLIAGANGAGKTTFVRQFLHVRYRGAVFLNANEINRECEALHHPVAAGRELLRRLERAKALGESFVLETTLSTRRDVRRLAACAGLGYRHPRSDDGGLRLVERSRKP